MKWIVLFLSLMALSGAVMFAEKNANAADRPIFESSKSGLPTPRQKPKTRPKAINEKQAPEESIDAAQSPAVQSQENQKSVRKKVQKKQKKVMPSSKFLVPE
jgi:hypothetical protein